MCVRCACVKVISGLCVCVCHLASPEGAGRTLHQQCANGGQQGSRILVLLPTEWNETWRSAVIPHSLSESVCVCVCVVCKTPGVGQAGLADLGFDLVDLGDHGPGRPSR